MEKILVSLSEKGVERLRKLAKWKGNKKGAISETVEMALEVLEKEFQREVAWRKLKALADEDIKWGIGKFDRNELYTGKRFD